MKYSVVGCSVTKLLCSALLLLLLGSFAVVVISVFTAKGDTTVTGIIYSDVTWTKANSPYMLTGPTAVNVGVTLTIEPGVTVDFNGHYIQLNGTLVARGTNADPINFSSGQIKFTPVSVDWNGQTGLGSIIEKAIFYKKTNADEYIPEIVIDNSSPKIANTTDITIIRVNGGSPIVYKNVLKNVEIIDGSPEVSYNTLGSVLIHAGDPIVAYNEISNGINPHENPEFTYGSPVICDNNITYPGSTGGFVIHLASTGTPIISNNNITGLMHQTSTDIYGRQGSTYYTAYGIKIKGNAIISNNIISGCTVASITLSPMYGEGNITMRSNTIVKHPVFNSTGVVIDGMISAEITGNNIQGGIYLSEGAANDVNATYNWWGTTDTQAIRELIFDFEDDYNLGKVSFTPFLTTPNPEAPEIPPMPTPTPTITPSPTFSPTPTPTPTESPQQTEFTIIIAATIMVAVLSAGLGLLIYLIKRK